MAYIAGILPQCKLLKKDSVERIFVALQEAAIPTRFVGGAVRDCLLGKPINDVDLAVNAPVEKIIKALEAANIRYHPLGIDHGCVMAVVYEDYFHITSLRQDVKTDGRHAQIAYTSDWGQDASRRDFTINALYADWQRKVYDPTGMGLNDLHRGIVRFIGDPEKRIKEDYLRILRFFRFHAGYATTYDDKAQAQAMTAITKYVNNIQDVSKERVTYEFLRLLEYDNPVPSLKLMHGAKLLQLIIHRDEFAFDSLTQLLEQSRQLKITPTASCRLFALYYKHIYTQVAPLQLVGDIFKALPSLVLSLAYQSEIGLLGQIYCQIFAQKKITALSLRRYVYQHGQAHGINILLIAIIDCDIHVEGVNECVSVVKDWEIPKFTITGMHLLECGAQSGPSMGRILRALEERWIDSDFTISENLLLHEAQVMINKSLNVT